VPAALQVVCTKAQIDLIIDAIRKCMNTFVNAIKDIWKKNTPVLRLEAVADFNSAAQREED